MTLVEKLTSIKYKLNKYATSNNKTKVCEYLNVLKSIQNIDASVLKEADIVSCLKELKKNNLKYFINFYLIRFIDNFS